MVLNNLTDNNFLIFILIIIGILLISNIIYFILNKKINHKESKLLDINEKLMLKDEVKEEVKEEVLPPTLKEEVKEEVLLTPTLKTNSYVSYIRSFQAKLIQSDDILKNYYETLKNELLAYDKVTSRISFNKESFRYKRELIALMQIKGKTLNLYLNLDPKLYLDSKYKINDLSDSKKYQGVETLYKIKNNRRLSLAKDLIKDAALKANTTFKEKKNVSYVRNLKYLSDEALIELGLIKVFNKEEVKEKLTNIKEKQVLKEEVIKPKIIKKTHDLSFKATINLDLINNYFNEGEVVDLKALKERIPGFNKKATYVKVLAFGNLNKALKLDLDAYSKEAILKVLKANGQIL